MTKELSPGDVVWLMPGFAPHSSFLYLPLVVLKRVAAKDPFADISHGDWPAHDDGPVYLLKSKLSSRTTHAYSFALTKNRPNRP